MGEMFPDGKAGNRFHFESPILGFGEHETGRKGLLAGCANSPYGKYAARGRWGAHGFKKSSLACGAWPPDYS